eukprot:3982857-Prymnesium_polylepis.1
MPLPSAWHVGVKVGADLCTRQYEQALACDCVSEDSPRTRTITHSHSVDFRTPRLISGNSCLRYCDTGISASERSPVKVK